MILKHYLRIAEERKKNSIFISFYYLHLMSLNCHSLEGTMKLNSVASSGRASKIRAKQSKETDLTSGPVSCYLDIVTNGQCDNKDSFLFAYLVSKCDWIILQFSLQGLIFGEPLDGEFIYTQQ